MTDLSKMADTLGYAAKIPKSSSKRYLHNQRIGLVEIKNNSIDKGYLYWLLRCEHYQKFVTGSATGATVKHTSPSKIYSFKFKAPHARITQQKIAAILSAYDDLIENNLQRIKLLEEMAQITYEEWFVRMKFPGHEPTPIDPETDLPEEWKIDQIENHFKTESGGTPSRTHPEYFNNGNICWIKTQELRNNIILSSLEKISEVGMKNSSAKIFPSKTVLLAMYGNTIGETGFLMIPAATNQACCAFLTDECHAYYIHQYLIKHKQQILNYRMGAAQENISQQIIKKIKILIPTNSILKKHGVIASHIYRGIGSIMSQNILLKEARDILLPRLMTGMIDVDKIELPDALLARMDAEESAA